MHHGNFKEREFCSRQKMEMTSYFARTDDKIRGIFLQRHHVQAHFYFVSELQMTVENKE